MIPFKNKPLYRQVEDFVRNRIASGEFPVNSKLPSTDALAVLTGTSVCTVQTALSSLCREGLLDRRTRHGTYVRGDKAALTCAGIYFNRPLALADSAFYQVLGRELQRRLGEQGVKTIIWSDDREESAQTEPLATLKQAMERREIQGLIAPLICHDDLLWLKKSPVATAMLTNDMSVKNGIGGRPGENLRLGLEALQQQGCRTVGVIGAFHLNPDRPQASEFDFYHSLVETTGELGLKLCNEWIRSPKQKAVCASSFGYEQFHALWDLKQRPEGLLVLPDTIVSGAVMAILERRVDVPRDLKLVLHANDLLQYPCPLPATFVVTRVGRLANTLIDLVRRQLNGHEIDRGRFPISITQGTGPLSPPPITDD